jgi:hypothetical protein
MAWDKADWDLAMQMYDAGANTGQIARALGRNPSSVRSKFRRVINSQAIIDKWTAEEIESQGVYAKMDHAFCSAMRAAIRSGKENAHIGVIVDTTPFTAKPIYPEPMNSGCSSAAALCAEMQSTRKLSDSVLA